MAEFSQYPLEQFVAQLKHDNFARSNRFEIFIHPPLALQTKWGWKLPRINIMIEDTALPGRTIETARLRIHGLTEQRARTIDFFGEAINFTFYVDNEWDMKTFFQDWQTLMVDPVSRAVGFYSEYIGEIEMRCLSMDETVSHSVSIFEAFPRSFQLVQISQGVNSIQRFVVAFAFKMWRENAVDRTSVPQPIIPPQTDTNIGDYINSKIQAVIDAVPLIIDANISKGSTLPQPLETVRRVLSP